MAARGAPRLPQTADFSSTVCVGWGGVLAPSQKMKARWIGVAEMKVMDPPVTHPLVDDYGVSAVWRRPGGR